MSSSELAFNCEWHRYEKYEVKNGKICPTKEAMKSEKITYNPFDFYTSEKDFTQKINDRPKIDDLQIHWSFASIKSENDVFDWVSKYGLPYYFYETKSENNNKLEKKNPFSLDKTVCNSQKNSLSMKEILKEAETFRNAIDLYNALKSGDSDSVFEIFAGSYERSTCKLLFYYGSSLNYESLSQHKCRDGNNNIVKLWHAVPANQPLPNKEPSTDNQVFIAANKDAFSIAQEYLSALISYSTQSVHETIKFTNAGSQSLAMIDFSFSSLLALLYRMLLIDWSKGHFVRRCADPRCNTYFVPLNDQNMFCSSLCKNRVKVEKFRNKKKYQK